MPRSCGKGPSILRNDFTGKLSQAWKRRRVFSRSKGQVGPLFDAAWYIKTYNLTGTEAAAWQHFLDVGCKTGAQPCQAFDTAWYLNQYKDVAASSINPLLHFIEYGAKELRQPHALFDTAWYMEQNPDVAATGLNPLAHYLDHGRSEGRNPIAFFDDFWYLSSYRDVARSKQLPIHHYYQHGVAESRNPSGDFDTQHYLEQNPDINPQVINPLLHYVKFGQFQGRQSKASIVQGYYDWIRYNEAGGYDHNLSLRESIKIFKETPTFSIVIPVYNPPVSYLIACIESVINQIYPFWELCIVDDASPNPQVRVTLQKYALLDHRIKIRFNENNLHIAGATNVALKMARGKFICLMDHDDEISVNALYEFALKLNLDPKLDMIYSDEDKIDIAGRRYEPFFKPDWSPEYLESCMYTAHFACYRKSVVDNIGGFREECNGAQDYDFVLRFTQQTASIGHVNKILYHWRAIPGSTAASMDNKDYVIGSAVRALKDYVKREGLEATVAPDTYNGCFRICRMVDGDPKVSIIIPTAGRDAVVGGRKLDLLANCVESILGKSTYKNVEIIVVHNGDLQESTLKRLADCPLRYVEFKGKFNVAEKMNEGAAVAAGEYLIFLNDDVEVIKPGWIEALLAPAQKPGVGVVGAKLLFETGEIQHVGVTFCEGLPDHILRGAARNDPGYFFSTVALRNYLAVTGACMLCSRKNFRKVGGFDERFAVNYNDIDLCLKMVQIDLRIVYTPQAELYHFESRNRARTVDAGEIELFLEKWREEVWTDPFYSRNFESRPPNFKLVISSKPVGSSSMPPL